MLLLTTVKETYNVINQSVSPAELNQTEPNIPLLWELVPLLISLNLNLFHKSVIISFVLSGGTLYFRQDDAPLL